MHSYHLSVVSPGSFYLALEKKGDTEEAEAGEEVMRAMLEEEYPDNCQPIALPELGKRHLNCLPFPLSTHSTWQAPEFGARVHAK